MDNEDVIIEYVKDEIRSVIRNNNVYETWIPVDSEELSLVGRKRAEQEVRKMIPNGWEFMLDRVGVARLVSPRRIKRR